MAVDTLEDAMLADVLANPDDDFPRRAYADWHLDHGNAARGEFIHLQLGIYAQSKAYYLSYANSGLEKMSALAEHRRASALLQDAWGWWLLDHGVGDRSYSWEFRRGFLDVVEHEYGDWLEYAPALVKAQPVEFVKYKGKEPVCDPSDVCFWQRMRHNTAWAGASVIEAVYFEEMARALGFVDPASPNELYYPSRESALHALSCAMLAVAGRKVVKGADPQKTATHRRKVR